jgi:bifunctional DNA-binding transcriptional regulator/antitoxin component of YhaV-PrlF toxin-antitoxin module
MSPVAAKVTLSGQLSLPAELRRRWKARRVLVIDKGDYAIVRPIPDDPIAAIGGKYAGSGPTSDEMRRIAREEEAEIEERKLRMHAIEP